MARHRYRRRDSNSGAAVVGDLVVVANRASWWVALLLGVVLWAVFSFALPAWIAHQQMAMNENLFRPLIDQLFTRRLHWLNWIGYACLAVGVFFAVKNYVWSQELDRDGRGVVAFLARLLGRSLD